MGKNTGFNRWMRVKQRIETFHFDVIKRQLTFDEYLAKRSEIQKSDDYQKSTLQEQHYYRGMDEAFYNLVKSSIFTEWRLFDKDDNLVLTGHSAEGLNYNFDYSACDARREKNLPIGHHVWKGTDGKKLWN